MAPEITSGLWTGSYLPSKRASWHIRGDSTRRETNLPTQYHQIPPPWLTIETKPFTDVERTVTLAPVFAEGENCLERPPPTNRVCYERNKILAFALLPSPGVCRQMGSITCKVDWETLQVRPSYGCAPEKQDPSKYPNVNDEFD